MVLEAGSLDDELGSLMQGDAVVGFIEEEIKVAEAEKAKAE
jgi:hypothetical protein